MRTMTVQQISSNIEELWTSLADGAVTIVSAGEPIAVVLAPDEYEALRHGQQKPVPQKARPIARPGFAKHLMPDLDVDALMNISIEDQWEGYL